MTPEARAAYRILYVTDGFAPFVVGGMQSYARRQLETIAASGYKLVSISSRGAPPPPDLPWHDVALPWPGRSRLRRLSPWRYVEDLKRFSTAVATIADQVRPDLIYSDGPLIHDWLRRPEQTLPTIFNPHGLEMFQRKGSLLEDLKSWPLRAIVADHAGRADAVACLSDGGQLRHILRERIGVPVERIVTLPNAAPPVRVQAQRSPPNGKRRLLFVGRDEPRKALPLLLDAFARIEDATLDIVGIGHLSGRTPPGVTLHGEVRDRERVRRYYDEADYLVAPSHAEGMPTVVLEAFSAGLPVIATDVGANADLVRTRETGFLVPRGDRTALQQAIEAALRLSAADYMQLSAACLAMARETYSARHAGDRLLSLLDGMLKPDRSDG